LYNNSCRLLLLLLGNRRRLILTSDLLAFVTFFDQQLDLTSE
jgi:hypothetical protein